MAVPRVCFPPLLLFSLSVYAADLEQASRLINEGKHTEAYELLIKDLEASAGAPDYDLLLGLAAPRF